MYFKLDALLNRHTPYTVTALLLSIFAESITDDLDTLFTVHDAERELKPKCLAHLPRLDLTQDEQGVFDVTPSDTNIRVFLESKNALGENTIEQWVDVMRFLMPFTDNGDVTLTLGTTTLTITPYGDVVASTDGVETTYTPDETDDYTRVLLERLFEYGRTLEGLVAVGKELATNEKAKLELQRRVWMCCNKLLLTLADPLPIPLAFAQQAVLLTIAKLTASGEVYTTLALNVERGKIRPVFYSRKKMETVVEELHQLPEDCLTDSVRKTIEAIWSFY